MRRSSLFTPLALIGVTMMMVVPVSATVLDVLLALNITLAIIVLLSVLLLSDSLELSVFPSLLLMTTLAIGIDQLDHVHLFALIRRADAFLGTC